MRWKYWISREGYPEPRSYVLERNERIVAHAGLWPVVLNGPSGTSRGVHLMDWASAPEAPGCGLALVRRLLAMFDFLYGIGGTQMTRKVLPALGFQRVLDFWTAARPLRVFQQMRSHQSFGWKLPARCVRNFVWSRTPNTTHTAGWTIKAADLNGTESELTTAGCPDRAARPNAFFRYLQKCPDAVVRVFDIHNGGRNEGRVAMSFVRNQARLLGLWPTSPSSEGLRAAYALAQQAARNTGCAFEITAAGSTAASEQAAADSGFRIMRRDPVYLLRRNGNLPPIPFEFQMADNDAGFLNGGRPEFLT